MLRDWILEAGIFVVEVPPVPFGYDFVCCLTHDVDFAGIRRHRLDRTVMGFLFRATLVCLADVLRGRQSLKRLRANWKAVFVWIMMIGDRQTRCNLFKEPGPDYMLVPSGKLYDPVSKNLLFAK